MATFPAYYTQATPSGRGQSVRSNLDVSTGEGMVAQATQNLGNELFQLGQKYDLKQANVQFSEAKRKVEETKTRESIALMGELDTDKHDAIHQQHTKEAQSYRPKNKRAAESFDLYMNTLSPAWDVDVLNGKIKRADDNFDADILSDITRLESGDGNASSIKDKIVRGYKVDKDTNLPVDRTKYIKFIAMANEAQVEGSIYTAIKSGQWSLAKDLIDKSPLDPDKKNVLTNRVESSRLQLSKDFENNINDRMIQADNDEMAAGQFDLIADTMKQDIINSQLDGTHKTRLLDDIRRWRTGTNEIDYNRLLALDQEMDAAQRTGFISKETRDRIVQANVEGVFGSRQKGGGERYNSRIRRFDNLKFDEKANTVSGIVSAFEADMEGEANTIFLFHEAKNKWFENNKDATPREAFIAIQRISDEYETMKPTEIAMRMFIEPTTLTPKRWKYTATDKKTGQRMGSNDGVIWQPIP